MNKTEIEEPSAVGNAGVTIARTKAAIGAFPKTEEVLP